MKQILLISQLFIVGACGQKSDTSKTHRHEVSIDSSVLSNNLKQHTADSTYSEWTNHQTADSIYSEWAKHQDSLRNVILRNKENKLLKESFLQEMYIRNVISISNDSLFVTIPFNKHGSDCIAPDCYSTDVSFSFKLGDTLVFPEKIDFQEHEHGCVDKEIKLSGSFIKTEQTSRHVIYHSIKYKRTLVLFCSKEETGTSAFYFTEIGQNRISGKNVYNIIKDYDEEDKNALYPFLSWILTTAEYENFLR